MIRGIFQYLTIVRMPGRLLRGVVAQFGSTGSRLPAPPATRHLRACFGNGTTTSKP